MENFNNLGDELVAEILLRLPTKSAFRLKVVCKRWYSLISSPHFIAEFVHLRRHRDVESSLVFEIIYCCDGTCKSGDCRKYHSEFKTISNSSLLCDVPLDYLPCFSKKLEASFDDLILCSCITSIRPYNVNYYVINLLTRQWIALPPPPAYVGRGFMEMIGFLCVPPLCSECKALDCSHHKFFLVRLFTDEFPCSMFNVQTFSSENGQWRTLVVSSPLPLEGSLVKTSLIAYRGMLHWLNMDCIVVYDPLNNPETFSHIIPLPIQLVARSSGIHFKLYVCKGHLRVVKCCGFVMDVWELEDYDFGIWNLVHKFYYHNVIYDNSLPSAMKSLLNYLSVVTLHPENEDLVYLRKNDGIALVNMKTKIVERYYPIKKNATLNFAAVFHLLDKWWPTPVSSLLH